VASGIIGFVRRRCYLLHEPSEERGTARKVREEKADFPTGAGEASKLLPGNVLPWVPSCRSAAARGPDVQAEREAAPPPRASSTEGGRPYLSRATRATRGSALASRKNRLWLERRRILELREQ
jgi:hypothetical protein